MICGRRRRLVFAWLTAAALTTAGCGTFDRDPTATWDADRLYKEAKNEMTVGNWKRARELLEKLEARYPFGRYAQQAQLEIAYTYYKEGEPAQAVSTIERFLRLYPNHVHADYAYFLKGLSLFSDDLGILGRRFRDPSSRDPQAMREAFDAYKALVTRFPDSRYVQPAIARMNYLVNALAQSEVNIARHYLQRGAYLAAIQRAQAALQDYGGAPAAEEALAILVKAYEALGLQDLRRDAERVLLANYPHSSFLKAR
ncbi:MAG: outer membrane protein assembly factor BamD [Sutterellaceae bacterium]|nr:outer membrane protein assembly factor BamD [Burkholderiaceae bacterium]MDW8430415.1 outer membrane protein assembly factor BamD [Sutterellaceae bacterium]